MTIDPDGPASSAEPDSGSSGSSTGTAARRARQQAQRTTPPAPDKRRPADSERAPTAVRLTRRELDPDVLASLEAERSFLLRSLDDLEREHEAGDVDDVDYEGLKDDYTARAAAVIRAIEQRRSAHRQARRSRPRSRTVGGVVALLVLSIGLGAFVAQSSGRREASETITGDIRLNSRDQLLNAKGAASEGRFTDAIGIYDEVLAAQPANAEALTYKGWLLYQTSTQANVAADQQLLVRQAKDLLDQALMVDETYADARVFRASVSGALGDYAAGLADLDAVAAGKIPVFMADRVEGLRGSLQAALASAPGTTVASTAP